MDALGSLWRSLMQGNGDAAVGKRLLEAIHEALASAVRERGVQALTPAELAPIKALCGQLLPAHCELFSLFFLCSSVAGWAGRGWDRVNLWSWWDGSSEPDVVG